MIGIFVRALALSAIATQAAAQVPPDILAKVKETGAVLNPQMIGATFDLYAARVAKSAPGVTITEDFAYGPDDRHRLDVFAPAARPAGGAPVVVFVPGGGFVGGGKSRPGIPFYFNVGVYSRATA